MKISIVLPEENMKATAIQVIADHRNGEGAEQSFPFVERYEYEILIAIQGTEILDRLKDSDAIVARGAASKAIKQAMPNTAVIEIPISGYDILYTIKAVFKRQGNALIGFVGTNNMLNSVTSAAKIIGAEFRQYHVASNTPDLIRAAVLSALGDGCGAIIGGIDACTTAEENGCPAYPLPASYESIWQAISDAKHTAVFRNEERKQRIMFDNLLDHAYEGILATDADGRIATINRAAQKLLNIDHKSIIGLPAQSVIRDQAFLTYLHGKEEYDNELISFEGRKLSANKSRMYLSGKYIGNIITFQDVYKIQKEEVSIRRKLFERGHVAKYRFPDIVCNSPKMAGVVRKAKVYAKSSSGILLVGESGTGKEVLAQSIHNESLYRDGPFVAVNCAALSPLLLESELFGYVEGAFTGASKGGKKGFFELAHGGTIFLDEISEIPLDMQGRLLRVIEEREVVRIGSDRVTPINVRVIAATNKPLDEMVRNNLFRKDLFFRINVLALFIPSIRERKEDILPLCELYLKKYYRDMPPPSFSQDAQLFLLESKWEGNVREIRNVCERIAILYQDEVIGCAQLKSVVAPFAESGSPEQEPLAAPPDGRRQTRSRFEEAERQQILDALQEHHCDKTKTAQALGFSRSTLWRRMQALEIVTPGYRPRNRPKE